MKCSELFETGLENGNISTVYRAREAEFEKLKNEAENRNLKVTLEKKATGNIWDNIRMYERNIEVLKKALQQ